MEAYATVEDYRLDSGDASTPDERVEAVLMQQSAKLRVKAGIDADKKLTDDQLQLARLLVTDAARKMLVAPTVDGMDDVTGIKQSSFSADGFQASYTFANASGSAYFDSDTFKAFMRSLRRFQRVGTMMPSYGGNR